MTSTDGRRDDLARAIYAVGLELGTKGTLAVADAVLPVVEAAVTTATEALEKVYVCAACFVLIEELDSGTVDDPNRWWVHAIHPSDGHDATPLDPTDIVAVREAESHRAEATAAARGEVAAARTALDQIAALCDKWALRSRSAKRMTRDLRALLPTQGETE